MRLRIGLLLIALLLTVSAVFATSADILVINAEHCGFTSGSNLECSDTLTATCDIAVDYTVPVSGQDETITDVTYCLNDGTCQAGSLSSGTYTNGTWTTSFDVDYRFDDRTSLELNLVRVQASSGTQCAFSKKPTDNDEAQCYGQFDSPYKVTNTCSCDVEVTFSDVDINNVGTYTRTPSAGCYDTTPSTFKYFADYCDPDWTPSYGACNANFASSSLSGNASKDYAAGDGGICCADTSSGAGYVWYNHNSGSDCVAPVDQGSVVSCTMDAWTQWGRDSSTSFGGRGAGNFGAEGVESTTILGDSKYQALVFDIDQDGYAEAIVAEDTKIRVYSLPDLTPEAQYTFTGVTGQPALMGYNSWYSSSGVAEEWFAPRVIAGNSPLIVVPVSDGGSYYLEALQYSGGSLSLYGQTSAQTSPFGGVTCFESRCYSYVEDDQMMWFDPVAATEDYKASDLDTAVTCGSTNCTWTTSSFSYQNGWVPTVIPNSDTDNIAVLFPRWLDNGGSPLFNGLWADEDLVAKATFEVDPALARSDCGASEGNCSRFSSPNIKTVGNPVYIADGKPALNSLVLAFEENTTYYGINRTWMYIAEVGKDYTHGHLDFFLGQALSSSMNLLWVGELQDDTEGMSNVVAVRDGYVAEIDVLSPSDIGGATSPFSDPDFYHSYAPASFSGSYQAQHVVTDDGSVLAYSPTGQSIVFVRTSDDTVLSTVTIATDYRGNNGFLGGVHLDDTTKRLYFDVNYDTISANALENVRMGCITFNNLIAIDYCYNAGLPSNKWNPYLATDNASGISEFGTFYGIQGDQLYVAYDCRSFDCGAGLYDKEGMAVMETSPLNDSLRTQLQPNWTASGNTNIQTDLLTDRASPFIPVQDGIVWYDTDNDLMLTNDHVVIGWSDGTSGGSATEEAPLPSQISGLAFNFDYASPKYVNTAGQLVTITSWSPFSTTTSSGQCADFIPVYWNAQSHVVGIVTNTPVTYNGPQWGYCDLTNPSSPQVDILPNAAGSAPNDALPYISSSCASTCDWTFYDTWRVWETSNQHDGDEADTYWFTISGTAAGNEVQMWKLDGERQTTTTQTQFSKLYKMSTNYLSNQLQLTTLFHQASYIAVADANGNTRLDVFTPDGYYDMTSLQYYFQNGLTDFFGDDTVYEWNQPVDANSDGTVDMLTLIPVSGLIKVHTSVPEVSSVTAGSVEVRNLICNAMDDGTATVRFGVAAPNPDDVEVYINKDDGTGEQYYATAVDGLYNLVYQEDGTYDVSIRIVDFQDSTQDTATCQFDITGTDGMCSMGAAGEFDFPESLRDRGWSVMSDNPTYPSGGRVTVSSGLAEYDLGTSCNYDTVTVTFGILPDTGSAWAISDQIQSGTSTSGVAYGMQFDNTDHTIQDQDGNVIGSYATSTAVHEAQFVFDQGSHEVRYYYDGSILETKTLVDGYVFRYAGLYPTVTADYVRVEVSGSQFTRIAQPVVDTVATGGTESYLDQCADSAIKDSSDLDVRKSYPNVGRYCQSTDDARCSYKELQLIDQRYGNCAKEAYNYCIYVTYPYENDIGVGDASTQAGTVCATMLGVGGFVNNIAGPSVIGIYSVLTSNVVSGLLIFLAVIIVVPLFIFAKRR